MHAIFDSTGMPIADRLEAWRSITSESLIPTEIDSPDPAAFTARIAALPLGAAQIASVSYTSLTARRTSPMIRLSDPEYYQVALIRAGRQGIDQHGHQAMLRAGDLVVYDSSRPFEAVVADTGTQAETVILQFPRRLLPLSTTEVARLYAVALPGADSVGGLLTQFMAAMADHDTAYTEHDRLRLGHIAVDLATAALAARLERDDPPPSSCSHVLYLRIIAFIEANLQRPDLEPATIAAAHHICLRYLYRIFEQHHHTSPTTHIRARRLDHARRDLADSRLDRLSIASIAARWGFTRAADFSRAFHHHTGTTPREYRGRWREAQRS